MPAHTDPMLRDGAFDGTIVITGWWNGAGPIGGRVSPVAGGNVVICGRRKDVVAATAAEMQHATGGKVLATGCDVRQPEQVEALLAVAYEQFGRVDVLLNNAAGNLFAPPSDFRTTRSTPWSIFGSRALGRGLRRAGDRRQDAGLVVSISTTYAWTGSGYVVPSAYMAKPADHDSISAAEWGKYRIRLTRSSCLRLPPKSAWSRLMPGEMADEARGSHSLGAGGRASGAGQPGGLLAFGLRFVHHGHVRDDRRRRMAARCGPVQPSGSRDWPSVGPTASHDAAEEEPTACASLEYS